MDKTLLQQARLRLEQAERILITAHTRPDGDAIGSVLALGLALQNQGRQVQIALADGIPAALKFLPGSGKVVNKSDGEFDLVIVLDSGNLKRVGRILDQYPIVDINLDHHPDNTRFGEINFIVPTAVSTTEILAEFIPEMGLTITPEIASNLLTGLITDTIGFKTSNMHPGALRLAADLYEKGADLPTLYHLALVQKTFEAANYIGSGLSQLTRKDGLVWTALTLENRKKSNYPGRDDADLVNTLSAIGDADVALIFIEQDDQHVKVSWRSRSPEIDVAQVAHTFGGGGHRTAAGAMIPGSLEEVQTKVIDTTYSKIFSQ